MSRKIKILITALFVIVVSFVMMYILSGGEKKEVENIVITYNDVLRRAHLELNASLLKRLTSERQMKKVDSYIAMNLKNGRIINGELRDLRFQDVQVQGESATAVTIEMWTWNYIDPVSKKPISEAFDDLYGNTYYLARTEGHWIVDDINSNVIDAGNE